MAKKRKNPFENKNDDPLFGLPSIPQSDIMSIGSALGGIVGDMMASGDDSVVRLMVEMINAGVTPEEYSAFYELSRVLENADKKSAPRGRKPTAKKALPKKLIKEFEDKTLWIRVQMKGVGKPPMWREVEIPADRDFLNLHHIIQFLVGLEDYHLWQFNRKAYNSDLSIALNDINDGFGEDPTDNPKETPIVAYLSNEGDALEYVYDFGNDWIFTVSLKKILDKKSDFPICTGFKSSLNAIEDIGGPWNYEELREIAENWQTYTKKKRKEVASQFGFDSPDDFHDLLDDSQFNLEFTNNSLNTL